MTARICAGPVVAFQQRAGAVDDTDRTVHLAVLPARSARGMISTLCAAMLVVEPVDNADPGVGMACISCMMLRTAIERPVTSAGELPAGGPTSVHRRASAEGYVALGWPITACQDQVLLTLGGDVSALVLPTTLAEQTMEILAERARPAPVLANPYAPEYRILITGEPFGILLPWPDEVHTAAGYLPLPPTVTPWVRLPDGHALSFCREIDVCGAVRTALHPIGQP